MKNIFFIKLLLLLPIFLLQSCTQTLDEKEACEVAQKFAERYYNLEVRKAKRYCVREMYPIMDFRASNIAQCDIEMVRNAGPAAVRVLDCDMDVENRTSYVEIEVSNFLRVDYINDSLSIIPCDTMEVIIVKDTDDHWLVKFPL